MTPNTDINDTSVDKPGIVGIVPIIIAILGVILFTLSLANALNAKDHTAIAAALLAVAATFKIIPMAFSKTKHRDMAGYALGYTGIIAAILITAATPLAFTDLMQFF
jgi:hypothetical protein